MDQSVFVICPACESSTLHEIIKDDQTRLVRCTACGLTHDVVPTPSRGIKMPVVVSQHETSIRKTAILGSDEQLIVGEELIIETSNGEVVAIEITALETKNDKRAEKAAATDVRTMWARAIDTVTVKISVHRRGKTRSVSMQVDGDRTFAVGGAEKIDGQHILIERIMLRDGRILSLEEQTAPAKNIKRIHARGKVWKQRR